MRRRRRRYPSDLTDAQWAQLAPLLPAAKPGGQPRTVDLREVVNAILYVLREGGADGRCRTTSRPGARRTGTSGRGGATALGSGASQRVKPAREDDAQGGPHGYDAGTQVLGRKRPSAVDTEGLLLRVVVHSAGIQDRDGGKRVVAHLAEPGAFPRLIHRWADGASGGTVAFRCPLRRPHHRVGAPSGRHQRVHRALPPLGGGAHLRLAGQLLVAEQGLRSPARDRGGLHLPSDDAPHAPPPGAGVTHDAALRTASNLSLDKTG